MPETWPKKPATNSHKQGNQHGQEMIVPVFTILVGIAWLLNVMGVMPGVDWVWTTDADPQLSNLPVPESLRAENPKDEHQG